MKLIDYHIHCNYSVDNENKIKDIVKKISEMNFRDTCIVAHFELFSFGNFHNSIAQDKIGNYFKEVEKYNKKFGQNVKIGLEVGYVEGHDKELEGVIKSHPFDFVLGSCHELERELVHDKTLFVKYNSAELAKMYFGKIRQMISTGLFDSIAHMDLIKKGSKEYGTQMLYVLYKDYIKEIARDLVKQKMCFEVNTNPGNLGDKSALYPSADAIKDLFDGGVRNVTVGSDSHDIIRIGDRMEEVITLLQEIGFTEISTFNRRVIKPVAISELMVK